MTKKHVDRIEALPVAKSGACCWECEQFVFIQAHGPDSPLTPGVDCTQDFEMACGKDHWRFDAYRDTATSMGRFLRLAAHCPDFTTRCCGHRMHKRNGVSTCYLDRNHVGEHRYRHD